MIKTNESVRVLTKALKALIEIDTYIYSFNPDIKATIEYLKDRIDANKKFCR